MRKIFPMLLVFGMIFLVSCEKKNENIISYSGKDIYLNCVEHESLISGFPDALLILESSEQLEAFWGEYTEWASLTEFAEIRTNYPIEEYVYVIEYFTRSYGTKVTCKELVINKEETTIHIAHKEKAPGEGPAAETSFITYAVLPKEDLAGYDFSKQQGVMYPGK